MRASQRGAGLGLLAAGGLCLLAALILAPGRGLPDGSDSALHTGSQLFRGVLLALAAALAGGGAWLGRDPAPAPPPREPAPARNSALLLVGILLLAAGLRFWKLGSGLWYDEIVTLVEFVRLPVGELLSTYTTPNNHILYSLLAHASVAGFGESAAALRLPAALFGLASLWAVYALGTEVANRREGLLASLLLAVSYHHVWFSQNGRGYTGLLCLALVGTTLFVRGLRRPRRGLWIAYAGVAALAMFVHLSAVFVFVSHGLVWLALFARSRRGAAGPAGASEAWPGFGLVLAALFTLQLYALLLPQMLDTFGAVNTHADGGAAAVGGMAWKSPLWTLLELVRELGLGLVSGLGLLAAAALGGAGVLSYLRRDPAVAMLFLLPVPITLAVLVAIHFNIWPRYFFVAAGFAALFLVRGAFVWGDLLGRGDSVRAGRLGAGLAAALVLVSAFGLPRNYRTPKQDYAAARDFVQGERSAGDRVATLGLATLPYARYYATDSDWDVVASPADLAVLRGGSGRTWIVYTFPAYTRAAHGDVLERVERDFEPVREFPGTVGDGTIYVWRTRQDG